ncbi:hypothetical protein GCK32_012244 [Trichostrongylus colubriformis]|uniref:Uncharacterized protein n=1 Tax=Trichostrongylus colubriformis TaxID=6319 RepID=A0AAN8EYP5_TRICO
MLKPATTFSRAPEGGQGRKAYPKALSSVNERSNLKKIMCSENRLGIRAFGGYRNPTSNYWRKALTYFAVPVEGVVACLCISACATLSHCLRLLCASTVPFCFAAREHSHALPAQSMNAAESGPSPSPFDVPVGKNLISS